MDQLHAKIPAFSQVYYPEYLSLVRVCEHPLRAVGEVVCCLRKREEVSQQPGWRVPLCKDAVAGTPRRPDLLSESWTWEQAPQRLQLGLGAPWPLPGRGGAAGGEQGIWEPRAAAAAQVSCLPAAPPSRGRWGPSMCARQEVRVREHLGRKGPRGGLFRGPGCLPGSNLGLSLGEICFHPVPAPPGSGELGSCAAGVRLE